MNKQPLPYETSIEDVLVRIRETIKNPNVGKVTQVSLKNGPRTFRLATLFEILDPRRKVFTTILCVLIRLIDQNLKAGLANRQHQFI